MSFFLIYEPCDLLRAAFQLNMFGMIVERFTESLVVMCVSLDWDCFSGDLKIKNSKERSSAGKGGRVDCRSNECLEKIKTCNKMLLTGEIIIGLISYFADVT